MQLEFLITSLIVVASPGTGALVTVAAGVSRGARAAIVAALGCTLGILPHMLAAITGLAALMHASAIAFEVLRYAGVAYLLYMAWMSMQARGPLNLESGARTPSDREVIRHAVLVNLLNPKLSIFFFAFLPQFVGYDELRPTLVMVQLSAIFMAMTFVVFAIYGLFAAAMRDHVISRPRVMAWMRRAFAAAFVALGARLAFSER